MGEILKMNTIHDYHEFLGVKTLHPLVSVIDLSEVPPIRMARKNLGFYTVFLKDVKCGDLRYGRKMYDYQEGTLVFIGPGQIVGADDNGTRVQAKGWALLFHPDLLLGTSLGRKMKDYSFFSYEANEALHMSDREREIVIQCFQGIREELEHAIDKHSKALIAMNIELLLNYCMRFYQRQFITRSNANKDALTKFEQLLNEYFLSKLPMQEGLPSVKYFADKICLSSNYFGDMVKKETGKTPQEHIQDKVIEMAKEHIVETNETVSQIAYTLGFQYPQHLCRLFKKRVGCTPNEYRTQQGQII